MQIGNRVTYSEYPFTVVGVVDDCPYGYLPEGSVMLRNDSGMTVAPISELVRVPNDGAGNDVITMRKILDQIEALHDDIDTIAIAFVHKNLKEMSERNPKRVFHFNAGMGSSCLFIEFDGKEHQVYGTWSTCRAYENGVGWIDELDRIGESIGNGCSSLPFGCSIKYKGGKEIC